MAHPGDLDATFGSGGKKTVNFGGIDAAQAVLVQPNGRVVVAGGGGPASSFCVVRLRSANGTLDPTFGSGGKRVIDFGTDDESVYGAALQPDGKIVLAGDSRLQPAVVRLKANGALDTSFDGDGRKLFSWGAIGRVTAVVVAPNGKLLLGGFSGPEGGNIQVARLKANGAFDTTFGAGGIATVDFGATSSARRWPARPTGASWWPDGRRPPAPWSRGCARPGVLDPDFGGGARDAARGGSLNAVLVQPDRNIVVAGNASGSATMTVTRLKPDGSLDTTFGSGGTATVAFGSLANPLGGAARQPDGKIVIAGYTQDGEDVAVARLNANGSLDAGFGAAGKATVDFGAATFGNAVALAPNGRIVVAGQKTGGDDFAVARLRG